MRSSDPQQQFLSAMQNSKFGLFRNQTGLAEIQQMLSGHSFRLETETEEIVALLDDTALYFSDESKTTLEAVKISAQPMPNMDLFRRLNLGWFEWVNLQSLQGISDLPIQSKIEHKIVTYVDSSHAVVRVKGISTIKIVYDAEGKLVELVNGFYWTEAINQIQELQTLGN